MDKAKKLGLIFMLAIFATILMPNSTTASEQKSQKDRVMRVFLQIINMPYFPKLEKFPQVALDDKLSNIGVAYYISETSSIHLYGKWVDGVTDNTLRFYLAHELGHYFDPFPRRNAEQNFADAFSLYVLDEGIFKQAVVDEIMNDWMDYKKTGENFEYYFEYYAKEAEKQSIIRLNAAKSSIWDVVVAIRLQDEIKNP